MAEHTRTLDFKIAFAIGLGTMIAAGIFSLSGAAVAMIGSGAVIGASRDRRLSQWVFGSTPDRVVGRAAEADVPVLVYASASGVPERVEDYLFPVYRYLRSRLGDRDTPTTKPKD